MKKMFVIISVLVVSITISAHAQQEPDTTQSLHGIAWNSWSFMTAWNLSSGAQQASSSWYNGTHRFQHPVPVWQQWIARFVYDQAQGRTRALAWYYDQPHVQ